MFWNPVTGRYQRTCSTLSPVRSQANTVEAVQVYTVRALEPLDSIEVLVTPVQSGSQNFTISILPDSGANVSAIEEQDAESLKLSPTSIILKGADCGALNIIGMFKAELSRHSNFATEDIYVVRGLSKPLLSRQMLKELGEIHKQFPHHVWYNTANHRDRKGPYNLQANSQNLSRSVPMPRMFQHANQHVKQLPNQLPSSSSSHGRKRQPPNQRQNGVKGQPQYKQLVSLPTNLPLGRPKQKSQPTAVNGCKSRSRFKLWQELQVKLMLNLQQ